MSKQASKLKVDLAFVNLALQSGRQFWLASRNQKAGDRLLMFMIAQHGTQVLARFAAANFQQATPALARLKQNNLANFDTLPNFGYDGFKKALAFLPLIQRTAGGVDAADYRAAQKAAFEQIDSLPAFGKFHAAAAEISARIPLMQSLLVFDGINVLDSKTSFTLRKLAREIQRSTAEISPADLLAAKDLIVEMKKTLPTIREQETARLLLLRIKTYEAALDLFGGKLHASLRHVISEIMIRETFEANNFAGLMKPDNTSISSALAAADQLIALAGAQAFTVAGVVLAPAINCTAHELTREGRQWSEPRSEDKLAAEMLRGIEYIDVRSGKPLRLNLNDAVTDFVKQFVTDLASVLTLLGTTTALPRIISKIGPQQFVNVLETRGIHLATLAANFQKADEIANRAGKPHFVQNYFKQLAAQNNLSSNNEIADDLVKTIIEGEYDKTAALLISMAHCISLGITFIPKNKFIEYLLKPGDLSKAAKLLDLMLHQIFDDGYTLRMKIGARIDAIDSKGRMSEIRPAPELAGHLQEYKAAEWLSGTKPKTAIGQIQLGDLGSALLSPSSKSWSSDAISAKPSQATTAGEFSTDLLMSIRRQLPEISSLGVAEYRRRLLERQDTWTEDLLSQSRSLLQIEPELQDAECVFSQTKEFYLTGEQLHVEAQHELSHQKGWFRRPLSERLTAIEHRIIEKAEILEQNHEHPLGRAKQEYDRLKHEYDTLKQALEKSTESRRTDLQRVLDYMQSEQGWPAVSIAGTRDHGSAGASYQFGQAKILVANEAVYAPAELDKLIFGEMAHALQDRQLAEFVLYRAEVDLESANAFYEQLTGHKPTHEFMAPIAESVGRKSRQQVDESRLFELAANIKTRNPNQHALQANLYLRYQFIEARLYNLRRDKNSKGLESLFNQLNLEASSSEFQKTLFGGAMPDEIERFFESWKRSLENGKPFLKKEAKLRIIEILENLFAQVQEEYAALVRDADRFEQRLDLEARMALSRQHYGILVGTSPPPPITAVTPYEAMQALTAAGTRKGDSLHPESRGWEATRKMYDTKLQQGVLSASQAKKLLGLPAEDREAIEAMLKNESPPLSKNVLAKLLQLESAAFHTLLGVPPTICNRVVVPALERGLIDTRRLDQILTLPEQQRRVALEFIDKAIKDTDHAFSGEHIERFLALPPAGRIDFAAAMSPNDGSRPLSSNEAALALSAPTRSASGKEFCDAAALVKALQRGIMSAEQVKEFAVLDENARSGISALLGTNALSRETAALLLQKLQTGELSEINARDLGVARLVGWLPDGSLSQVLKLDAALRNTLFDRLAAETPRGKPGSFSVPDFLQRQAPLNEMRKQGVINEPTLRQLGTQHASDILIWDLLHTQARRTASDRISPESIQQLILLSRAAKINLETLEAYRQGIERSWLDRNTLKSMLAQKPELKQAAETYLKLDPEMFFSLSREGRYAAMATHADQLKIPAQAIFPSIFPADGKIVIPKFAGANNALESTPAMAQFSEQMHKFDFAGAIQTIVENAANAQTEIRFQEKRVPLYDLNRMQIMQALSASIHANGREKGEADPSPESDETGISSADPVILLSSTHEIRLRDASLISENGQWRQTSYQEKMLIESIQSSDNGKAILGTVALVLASAWAQKTSAKMTPESITSMATKTAAMPAAQTQFDPALAEARAVESEDASGSDSIAIRYLQADNFAGLSRGHSEHIFASGKKAAILMPPEKFRIVEQAYNQYMRALARASILALPEREAKMAELVYRFDQEFAEALKYTGIRLGNSSQPYMRLLFDITLLDKFRSKKHSARTPVAPIDLNTEQGLKRFLAEHAQGKRIYIELASVKRSGITPKFDPAPASGRPARLNPQDLRKLSNQQRSAVAVAILNDSAGWLQGTYQAPESGVFKAIAEMTVFSAGDGVTNSAAAFNRAEVWTYLMVALNDNKPISAGGKMVSQLLDLGEFRQYNCNRETLIQSNDFMQVLHAYGVLADEALWDEPGHFRQEIEARLAKERGSLAHTARSGERLARPASAIEPVLRFDRGESVIYNSEQFRLIGRDESNKNALIMYDGITREPSATIQRNVLEHELDAGYQPILSGNNIHIRSIGEESRGTIFILTINQDGEKQLHTDSQLRFVSAAELQTQKPGNNDLDNLDKSLARQIFLQAREIFDNYKEYSIGVGGQTKPLPFKQVVLGRGNDVGIRVLDEANFVGSRHLQVLVTAQGIAVQDLNSKNGSFLNGRRLDPYETVNLRTTDRVALGSTEGPVMALIFKPTERSTAPEYRYIVGDKTLEPGAKPLIIGRLATADAFVSDPTVSKIQATVRMTIEGRVLIKDGGNKPSANGLVINGEQMNPGTELELNPGDKVATRTGVILPISYEKKRSRFSLLAETGSGRVNIKDASLAGSPVFLGVDPRHGVYALPKNNSVWLARRAKKLTGQKSFNIKQAEISKKENNYAESGSTTAYGNARPFKNQSGQNGDSTSNKQEILYARGKPSAQALQQSNQFATMHFIESKLEDGWSSVGKGKTIDPDGGFEAPNRVATTVDRENDSVLHSVLEDSKRRFWHLSPELRARALNEYARDLLTPTYMNAEQLDRWYNQFSHDHQGKRILLGEFIKEGKGICTQQALLLKTLADEFDDMRCKLVRGMDGCHAWTTFILSGKEIIHDPRGRFISPVTGQSGALPQAIHWVADTESAIEELARQTYVKVGDSVSYDGTTGWKVSSYDTLSGDIVLTCNGSRSVCSADLALANPGRMLILGDKYSIPRDDNESLDSGAEAWTLEGINKDATLKFYKEGEIEVQARLDQVRLRAEKKKT